MPAEELTVAGKHGEPIPLPIARGPATGYDWQLDLPTGVRQIADGPPRTVDPNTRLGSASGGYLQVEADEAGDYIITARLVRPWQPDEPARIVRITLRVTE
jgi:predicted secreted protein